MPPPHAEPLGRILPKLRFQQQLPLTALVDEPIRAEVYGPERLAECARGLAAAHELTVDSRAVRPFMQRFRQNERVLQHAHWHFSAEARRNRPLPPSADWLLDNYHVVQNNLVQVKHDLSRNYYRQLPKLASGPNAGFPRVYDLALTLLAHTDSHFDQELVTHFFTEYQAVAPLTIGELWAVAIMLRLALIENLRRIIGQALVTQRKRTDATLWANRLIKLSAGSPTQLVLAAASLPRNYSSLDSAFVVHLLERLRDQTPGVAPVVYWLEQWLGEHGANIDSLTLADHQRRAANRISVGNVITSLRTVQAMDWTAFFEDTSRVEVVLRQDPAGVYARVDLATRDACRHVVERLSRRTKRSELEVARQAVEHAASHAAAPYQHGEPGGDPRLSHVGYYLLDRGRPGLEEALGYRPGLAEALYNFVTRHPSFVYLGGLILVLAVLLAPLLGYAARQGMGAPGLVLLSLLLLLPLSAIAVNGINTLATLLLPPRRLPRMAFDDGVPAQHRTLVAVPALISDLQGIDRLFDGLEAYFLANRDRHLHFALLSDFADAGQQQCPEDSSLLDAAARRVRALNDRYGGGREDRFLFLHRHRTWNPNEGTWMGWERKRGKLVELNRLLRGAVGTSYSVQAGDASVLTDVKYVLTLDADTQLPINSARRLVGAMAHPLNRPIHDAAARRIVDGYAIIQPRTAVSALAAAATPFARYYAGDIGLDPYSGLVSNVYQDLFGTGSYIGKAIYDVDALHAVLDQRFPENLLLSHDLLEGSYVRVGQLSEVQLLEDFPASYTAWSQRQHRWIRGDWQIAGWLLPGVPAPNGQREPNPLPLNARWRIFDNLRQSLVPPSLVLLLALGWLVLPGSPLLWTAVALLTLLLPSLTSLLLVSGLHPVGQPWAAYRRVVQQETSQTAARAFLALSFLLHDALTNLDAIGRVVVRRLITRRGLLEWQSAAALEDAGAGGRAEFWRRMWAAPAAAILLLVLVLLAAPEAWLAAVPFLLVWSASPQVAWYFSQPRRTPPRAELPESDRLALRIEARRIWRFYEAFAGPGDNWLPPDNYQVEPRPVVAHRTSPTNIAFLLLSALAAHDFGYVPAAGLAVRLENCLATLDKLERYRGHFLNWYNTETLAPLVPEYVSTVDSGNLAAALFALKQGCLEVTARPLSPLPVLRGLRDTLTALRQAVEDYEPAVPRGRAARQQMAAEAAAFEQRLAQQPLEPAAFRALLDEAARAAHSLAERAETLADGAGAAAPDEVRAWASLLSRDAVAHLSALNDLMPWLDAQPPDAAAAPDEAGPGAGGWPSLRALAAQPTDAAASAGPTSQTAARLVARFDALALQAETMARTMQFDFLFHSGRGVFAIGFNLTTQRLDNSHYDLLASEARLASLVAVAQGQVSARHWFRLGRPLAWVSGGPALLSWSGTMFEYLMPSLLLYDFDYTLLAETMPAVLRAQREYAAGRRVPWGISESGYYAFDHQFNFQYRAFGVPDLGLRRETGEDLVVTPYATFLALHLDPIEAWRNLQHLAREGMRNGYGYYEAIDYTPARRPRGQRAGIVSSLMAHHQGMSLVALDNFFNDGAMRRRLHAEPIISAVELLLHERAPRHVPLATSLPDVAMDDGRPAGPASARRTHVPRTRTCCRMAPTRSC
jgi:cyclic beta-1,2-glucan synthetase